MDGVYAGNWVSGKPHGAGTFTSSKGVRYEGEWIGGKQSGRGVETTRDGTRMEGTFVEGKKHGVFLCWTSDGRQERQEWAQGVCIATSATTIASPGTELSPPCGRLSSLKRLVCVFIEV